MQIGMCRLVVDATTGGLQGLHISRAGTLALVLAALALKVDPAIAAEQPAQPHNPDKNDRAGASQLVGKLKGDPSTLSIVEMLRQRGSFRTFLRLAAIAGVTRELRSGSPLTLLAPTDAAFRKLPQALLARLQRDPQRLSMILHYHMISGQMTQKLLAAYRTYPTVQSQRVRIGKTRSAPEASRLLTHFDRARVLSGDQRCRNGIVHVIDSVLMPIFRVY